MKITQIHKNQTIRVFKPSPRLEKNNVKGLKFIRAIEDKYGFFQAPRTLPDYDIKTGITFLNGQFKKGWIIERLKWFENGVLLEGNAKTDELDECLDDMFKWAAKFLKLPFSYFSESHRLYLSQFDAEIEDLNVAATLPFAAIGQKIGEMIKSYGRDIPDFDVTEFRMQAGGGSMASDMAGAAYIITRKLGEPLISNLYFCSAPLKHNDHIKVVNEVVSALKSMAATNAP